MREDHPIAPLPTSRKPEWLKVRLPSGESFAEIKRLREELRLATVCEEARCPNMGECWGAGTATFMLLGDTCTRGCRFCNVATGNPRGRIDAAEPESVLHAVRTMRLSYVVLTMVDRDDLADGGAAHVATTIRLLRTEETNLKVEILAGDFQGNAKDIQTVVTAGAQVFAHNIETVRRLTPRVRDRRCGYDRTLEVLRQAKVERPDVVTKSSVMLGLGETENEIDETLGDLLAVGVEILTLGQYLRPAQKFLPVEEYVRPEVFDALKRRAEAMGFAYCASGPLVRSSYRAGEAFLENRLDGRSAEGGSVEREKKNAAG